MRCQAGIKLASSCRILWSLSKSSVYLSALPQRKLVAIRMSGLAWVVMNRSLMTIESSLAALVDTTISVVTLNKWCLWSSGHITSDVVGVFWHRDFDLSWWSGDVHPEVFEVLALLTSNWSILSLRLLLMISMSSSLSDNRGLSLDGPWWLHLPLHPPLILFPLLPIIDSSSWIMPELLTMDSRPYQLRLGCDDQFFYLRLFYLESYQLRLGCDQFLI
jgi:hypothetical protein